MYDLIAERKPYHPWIPTQQLWNCFYEMHTFKKNPLPQKTEENKCNKSGTPNMQGVG